ncbi:MAG: hypothetical protein EYC70_08710 [Planctomycetota bacterium]|nr:MAG: hypothetical protein EYC70_08710 [Planctomycetota bacterium]
MSPAAGLRGLALLLGTVAAGCFQAGNPAGATAGQAALSGQSGGGGRLLTVTVPDVQHPEEFLARVTREFQVASGGGALLRYRELLQSDGQGGIRLDVTGFAPDAQSGFGPPAQELQATYENRQRYMVKYRDAHLRDALRARQNYVWEEVPGTTTVASRPCQVYRARSRHGFGTVEMSVDVDSRMLLGWALIDAQGTEQQRLQGAALDLSPDLSNVVWSQPSTVDHPYTGSELDHAQLGFRPLRADYIPYGFGAAQRLVLQPLDTSVAPLYLEVYDDGLQVLLVAQQRVTPSGGQPAGTLVFARNCTIGGISVAEGEIAGSDGEASTVYVVGSLPVDELNVVLGSMRD